MAGVVEVTGTQGEVYTQVGVPVFTGVYVGAGVFGVLAADKARPQKVFGKLPLHVVQHLQKRRDAHDTAGNLIGAHFCRSVRESSLLVDFPLSQRQGGRRVALP